MEHKLGEVFEDGGVKLKVEKSINGCHGCTFLHDICCKRSSTCETCMSFLRKDHDSVMFVKVNNNKDMGKRNIKLDLNTAKEWYSGSNETLKKLALQAYKEEELKDGLPNTWEEFCEKTKIHKGECLFGGYWGYSNITRAPLGTYGQISHDRNFFPNEKSAEAHLALLKLEQLRDCYRNGWKPDWEDDERKYIIYNYRNKVEMSFADGLSQFLSFPTIELCTKFLANFKDLIEIAKDYI